ncbi:uncharacterized protein JN550_001612 [Neoarthrinium moseri]|uniref:uncharacterized protein n=1 Tax=Neoarthrinium moseri TaxID=1658444 RepID=UPI001FDB862E|nr:uncharacterized protein JN550_001612 [Neoarthrinium moseri]KAI1876116.1 hypothetical protein JN550_001612 [Neoarthrinium moseri]
MGAIVTATGPGDQLVDRLAAPRSPGQPAGQPQKPPSRSPPTPCRPGARAIPGSHHRHYGSCGLAVDVLWTLVHASDGADCWSTGALGTLAQRPKPKSLQGLTDDNITSVTWTTPLV